MTGPTHFRPPDRRTTCMVLALAVGVAMGFCAVPIIFRHSPCEMARSYVIIRALRNDRLPKPDLCILGNSVVMNGVDAGRLSQAMPRHPLAWNLSTPAQNLLEGLIMLDELPPSSTLVVWGVSVATLVAPDCDIPSNRCAGYTMYGFSPERETLDLARHVGAKEMMGYLNSGLWGKHARARWIVRASVDAACRSFLRKDLDLERAQRDLLYPCPYTRKVPPATLQQLFKHFHRPRTAEQGRIAKSAGIIFRHARDVLRRRHARLVVVILPDHPHLAGMTERGFYVQLEESLQALRNDGIVVLDAKHLLDESMFIDQIHPDKAGAVKLTDFIASRIADQLEESGAL